MMWTKVRGMTRQFKKPVNWIDEIDGQCGTLPVREVREGQHISHYSNWKPTLDELDLLRNGGVVELCCVGVQPPVSVGVVEEYKGD
jgi:hypothetical protein